MVVDKKQIEIWFANANEKNTQRRKACLFYGRAGSGKTSTAHDMSQKFGYEVIEFNSSNERSKDLFTSLKKSITVKTIVPVVYLFDEADGIPRSSFDTVKEIILNSIHPIILTVNDRYKIPQSIRDLCFEVEFRIRLSEVLDIVKKNSGNVSEAALQNVVPDFRQAKLMKYNTEGYRKRLTTTELITEGLRTGNLGETELESDQLVQLLDNSGQFYGIELIRLIEGIRLANKGVSYALNDIKDVTIKITPSYFFEKLNKVRGKHQVESDE